MKRSLLVRSFGYGIMSAEIVPPPDKVVGPNGDRSGTESEVLRMVRGSGISAVEAVSDPEDSNRVYLMMDSGHRPSRYELGQMDDAEWERLRTAVDAAGSASFSGRLTMLEEDRTPAAAAVRRA